MALYVREIGPAGAATIVLLHGGGLSGWMWDPQVEQLKDEYHLLVPDLPEHGQSAGDKPFTMPAAAACVADLIRSRAHGGRAHVVGLSLGAQTAVQLLAVAPEVVDHAIVSGTLAVRLPGTRLLRPMIWLNMPLLKLDWLVRLQARRAGVPEQYYAAMKADTLALTLDALVHIYQANMGFGVPAGLERVKAPVLIAVGQKEPGLAHSSARKLLTAIPGSRAVVVPGVGHTWNLQAPDLFTQVIRDWIGDRPLPPSLLPPNRK